MCRLMQDAGHTIYKISDFILNFAFSNMTYPSSNTLGLALDKGERRKKCRGEGLKKYKYL